MTGIVDHLLATPMWLTLLVIFAVPALEASAFLGFVFPGETVLVLGGVVASQGHVPLAAVLVVGIAGAIMGDSVGYVVGRRWGRWILDSALGRFVKSEHLDTAETALSERGGWTVFIGRFTVALRVLVPGLAGMGRMPFRTFVTYNVAGGALWGGLMVLAGYLAGHSLHLVEHVISGFGVALLLVLVALFFVVRAVRRRRRRAEETGPHGRHYVEHRERRDVVREREGDG